MVSNLEFVLDGAVTDAGRARRVLLDLLAHMCDVPHTVAQDAALMVSELVSNVVLHAPGFVSHPCREV